MKDGVFVIEVSSCGNPDSTFLLKDIVHIDNRQLNNEFFDTLQAAINTLEKPQNSRMLTRSLQIHYYSLSGHYQHGKKRIVFSQYIDWRTQNREVFVPNEQVENAVLAALKNRR